MLTFRDATADQAGLISHIYATSWRKTYRGLSSLVLYLKVVDWMIGICRGCPFSGVYPACTHFVPILRRHLPALRKPQ